jgi:hypothetical protein
VHVSGAFLQLRWGLTLLRLLPISVLVTPFVCFFF